jgi:lipopolysaccharide/colanic/teichoic acid biosynthesis glycosyltransferase
MLKRLVDIIISLLGIIVLSPLFLLFFILIRIETKGNPLFKQIRVGKNGKMFHMYKFRSMTQNAESAGFITVGNNDMRITNVGKMLRKYKLDELPQLINVLIGNMSLVGPRPEVPKYVEIYTPEQLEVLSVKPGITDYASIAYSNESELLALSPNPEKLYVEQILPTKLSLNLKYIQEQSIFTDFKIILKTILKIISVKK